MADNSYVFHATASEDLSDKEGYGAQADGAGGVELADATTDIIAGVLVSGGASGATVSVALPGAIVPVKVSATVKRFDAGKIAADGTFALSAFAADDVICVRFLENGVSGDLVSALVLPPHKAA